MMIKTVILTFFIFILFFSPAKAGELSGFVAVDGRSFFSNSGFEGQESAGLSFVAEPEYYHEFDSGEDSILFHLLVRLDQHDDRRTHVDIRELNWLHVDDGWELRTGIAKVFWGVTETRHLVNIINQDDQVEDVDGEDKLGQPMVDLALIGDNYGTLRFFVLPGFRERTFQGREGRPRSALVVNVDNAQYKSSQEDKHIDYAIRYNGIYDDWDYGISQFYGTSREPRLVQNGDALTPHYDIISQTGIDLQGTFDEWLWKFEGIYRSGQAETEGIGSSYDFAAAVTGIEYTFFSVFDSGADFGVLVEYLWDGRPGDAPSTSQENDIFMGSRITMNDIQSTEFLAGGTVDIDNGTKGLFAEFGRRIGDSWKVELDARFIVDADVHDISYPGRRDDFIQLRIAKYF